MYYTRAPVPESPPFWFADTEDWEWHWHVGSADNTRVRAGLRPPGPSYTTTPGLRFFVCEHSHCMRTLFRLDEPCVSPGSSISLPGASSTPALCRHLCGRCWAASLLLLTAPAHWDLLSGVSFWDHSVAAHAWQKLAWWRHLILYLQPSHRMLLGPCTEIITGVR